MDFNKEQYIKSFTLDNGEEYSYYDIASVCEDFGRDVKSLPYSIRILLEAAVRQYDGNRVTKKHIEDLVNWTDTQTIEEYPFKPARVLLQDFTGVPAVVDLASMRDAMDNLDLDPDFINPSIPVDLVIDHSVQVDFAGTDDAAEKNQAREFERNDERYRFIKWSQNAFDNFKVVPNNTGIIHQVNIEYLADIVASSVDEEGRLVAYPDTVYGTDSHTTMANGVSVLGWGVGGIEAEAAMLGQFSYNPLPEVVGVELVGELAPTVNATDLALTVTQILREHQVVGKLVEFYGDGYETLAASDRTTIANMAPEYGATSGFFPNDQETLNYMKLTNRTDDQIDLVKKYAQANNIWYNENDEVEYSSVVRIDLSKVTTSISGPKRPQDKIDLPDAKKAFNSFLTNEVGNQGFGLDESEVDNEVTFELDGEEVTLRHGSIIIAALTSCTNTANPNVMMAAGLIARNAVEKGLKLPPYVKASLAPGSKTVTKYLANAGLTPYLDELGFNVVGYGCTTCIGNSGPIRPEISRAINEGNIISSSVLSGNRNFDGRIHPDCRSNFLAAPPLVIAYALAGRIDIDLTTEPIGQNDRGEDIYLKDIWPSDELVNEYVDKYVTQEVYAETYASLYDDNKQWQELEVSENPVYQWDEKSTYVQNPPYFDGMTLEVDELNDLSELRVLAKFGDSITTDHISPAGAIGLNSPAGQYLTERGVDYNDFNSFGSRRGNHEVMMRGTFGNIRIINQLADGKVGSYTKYWPTGEMTSIYDAAMRYGEEGTGLVVLAGDDYGMGSSRDWAAKGTLLLNVEVVIAKSFERIHRSNLPMMGVLPLQFMEGEDADTLGLTGEEIFNVPLTKDTGIHEIIEVTATHPETGKVTKFDTLVRFDSSADIDYYHNGGILPYVIRETAKA